MNNSNQMLPVIALALGIISIPLACLYAYLGIIAGAAGIILTVIARKSNRSGMTTAALICSIIGIVLGIVSIVLVIALYVMATR